VEELYFRQELSVSLEEAWAFFSDPSNLKEITPPHMDFKVTSSHHGNQIYAGQIIRYTVRPILGIPLKWCTEITHVEPFKYFIDEQRSGPYAFWHHQHHFKQIENGVLMEDILTYKVPFGILGDIANAIMVRKEVNEIFTYRKRILSEKFG
jgi:ligand-binding SRPBCC domain-containing protein